MSKDEIANIAYALSDEFTECARKGDSDWVSTFNYFDGNYSGWSGRDGEFGDNQRTFLEVSLAEPLHGVDRKFLYSYWRECFANRQQLYLVFVNAEPASAGGGGIGGVSQLGGRAVALVWRDPAMPELNGATRMKRDALRSNVNSYRQNRKNCPPHRSRVLFFHQFD